MGLLGGAHLLRGKRLPSGATGVGRTRLVGGRRLLSRARRLHRALGLLVGGWADGREQPALGCAAVRGDLVEPDLGGGGGQAGAEVLALLLLLGLWGRGLAVRLLSCRGGLDVRLLGGRLRCLGPRLGGHGQLLGGLAGRLGVVRLRLGALVPGAEALGCGRLRRGELVGVRVEAVGGLLRHAVLIARSRGRQHSRLL